MKKALLLCGSHNDLGSILALKKLGFYIILTGNIENLPGQKWCNKFIKCDYSDKLAILDIALKEHIDVIVQCCNDFGVYTASYVAEKLVLPGYDTYETTLKLHNKDKFKQLAIDLELDCPKSTSFSSKKDAIEYISKINFPIIVKPTDASAGNGISKVESFESAEYAIDYAFENSRSHIIVTEPYITGQQGGFCTFLINKKVVAVCNNNEYSIINPYRVEIDTFPGDLPSSSKKRLIEQIELIAEKLNLCDGIFHLQYIYDGEKAYIIEVMRRILGNMYHVPGNFSSGINWEYWETRARTGMSLDGFPPNIVQEGFFAYKTILADKNGVIDSINLDDDYKKDMIYSYILKGKGDLVRNYKTQPCGFIFLMYSSADEMHRSLITNYRNNLAKII